MEELFVEFGKISRLNRPCVITEKIDGTNAQILITEDKTDIAGISIQTMKVGSRTRWLSAKEDNHGFFKWATEHADELRQLGPGRHYGEWWGLGIQRKYGQETKRFSLFNTGKWRAPGSLGGTTDAPRCCDVVPVLYEGPFTTDAVSTQVERLRTLGSVAAPGFTNPEGVVIYHTHGNLYFKVTLKDDDVPKSKGKRDTDPT